jgi:hypothetical protein
MAVRFTLYEQFSALFTKLVQPSSSGTAWQSLLAGACAGSLSVVLNQPVDVVKSNMQGLCASRYRGNVHCARQILATEGVRGLYKGLLIRMIRVTIETSLMFTFYGTLFLLLLERLLPVPEA